MYRGRQKPSAPTVPCEGRQGSEAVGPGRKGHSLTERTRWAQAFLYGAGVGGDWNGYSASKPHTHHLHPTWRGETRAQAMSLESGSWGVFYIMWVSELRSKRDGQSSTASVRTGRALFQHSNVVSGQTGWQPPHHSICPSH